MATVNIIISDESFGNPIGDTTDMGTDITPGSETDTVDFYISHDAEVSPITSCAIYMTEYTGSNYLGSSIEDDLVELLGWGDSGYGVKIKQYGGTWDTIRNGHGDIDNEISLTTDAVTTGTPAGAGQIPVGGEAYIQVKFQAPSPSGGAGYRAVSLIFEYSATS